MAFDLPGTAHTRAAIAIAMMLTLTACGDDAGGTGSGDAGGSDTAGSMAGAGGSGGEGQGGDGEGGGGETSAPELGATIGIVNVRHEATGEVHGSFYAAFGQLVTGTVDGPERGCAGDTWSSDDPDPPEPPPLATVDALGVEGTLVPVSPQRAEGGTYEAFTSEPIVGLGREIRFHGSGGGVPAFDLTERLTSRAALRSPTRELGIDRTRDLDVTWSVEGGGGQLNITLHTERTEDGIVTYHDVQCWSPMADGTLQIPAAMLADLVGRRVDVSVVSGTQSRVVIDDWLFFVGALDVTRLDLPLHDGEVE